MLQFNCLMISNLFNGEISMNFYKPDVLNTFFRRAIQSLSELQFIPDDENDSIFGAIDVIKTHLKFMIKTACQTHELKLKVVLNSGSSVILTSSNFTRGIANYELVKSIEVVE